MIHFNNVNTQTAASLQVNNNYKAQSSNAPNVSFGNFGGNDNLSNILQQLLNLVQQLLDSDFGQSAGQTDSNSTPQNTNSSMDNGQGQGGGSQGHGMMQGGVSGNGMSQSNMGAMGNTGMMHNCMGQHGINSDVPQNNMGAMGNTGAMNNGMGQNSMNAGMPQMMMGNTGPVQSAQAFNTPVGANEPGPAFSGDAYEVTFAAQPGQSVSLASMLIETNDQFVGTDANGIELFDENGVPKEGDITALLPVWDAGTEANEPVGSGPNQPMRTPGPEASPPDSDNRVRLSNEGLPPLNELIKGDLKYNDDGTFTLRIENVSGQNGSLDNPLSPGVLAVHDSNFNPFFDLNQPDRGLGLEDIAESGDPALLLASLQAQINRTTAD